MAEGGTIKAQMEELDKKLHEENAAWIEARLPPVGAIYRMNNTEFDHHCHIEALTRIVREVLGVSEEQMNLVYKEVLLQELKAMRGQAAEARREALRRAITDGVNPEI